ncbi:MAG: sugar phosphate isomerase/epimerase [Candidatus Sumerlaeia bacterium]|nr:sugar phosphate isomerase/epimerase [Candidatus Sumerlaeia bacterium]
MLNTQWTRRQLIHAGAGASAAALLAPHTPALSAPAAAAKSRARGADGIRLGSVAWNFGRIGDDPPWSGAIDAVGDLGFAAIELIVAKPEQLDATVAEPTFSTLLRRLEQYKLVVSQFVLYQSVMADLGSPDPERRKKTLAVFEKGCQVAAKLGAPMINMVAPWPTGWSKKGQGYLPRYFSTRKGETTFQFDVPPNFDFPRTWADFVATMKEATTIARNAGLVFSLENHTHTLIPGPDAFLRLWDEVRDSALGMNLDIGWMMLQREYPVTAIYKVRGHLVNVHLRDMDAANLRFVAPGEGIMDFEGVVRALRDIGFAGFATFEQDGVPDMKTALRRGKDILEGLLARTG